MSRRPPTIDMLLPLSPHARPARFALRMAWREMRAAWRHFLAFFVCVALGVGALVGVGSFAASLDRTLARESRALMGGDLELRSARPLDPQAEARVAHLAGAGATLTRIRELVSMVRHPGRGAALLVELKAVETAYPLYGRLEREPDRPLAELLGPDGALVEEGLLTRLGLRVGDSLLIGAARFTIAGILRREPDRAASVFTLGPRVLIGAAGLPRTGLIQLGSRVRYRTLVRLPDTRPAATVAEALGRDLGEPAVRIATADEAQPGLRRFFGQLTMYLGLVGLVSLLVGGIGVAAAVRSFVRTKLISIAVLKVVGGTSRLLVSTYALQALLLGALGSAAGVGLGLGVQALLVPLLAGFVPFEIEARPSALVAARGVLMGVLVTLLCALWPLLEVRRVRPAILLRHPVETWRGARRPWLAAVLIAAGLAALSLWQAGSLKIGGVFVGAAGLALCLLALAGRGVGALARRLPRLPSLAARHGLANLHRPGSDTAGVVVALGIGVMLVVVVAVLERGLTRQLDHERRREAPSFFFVDIQPDQVDGFVQAVTRLDGGTPPTVTPVVRARLAAVGGRPVTPAARHGRAEDTWHLTREYALTFSNAPPPTNAIVRGRWWTANEAAERPRISVEEEIARRLEVDVGGTLTFDVQGVRIDAEVMSLRRVDWQSLSTNFFVVFSAGALDGAPVTYIATARVPRAVEAQLQDAVAAAFPNVTAIPVRDVLDRVLRVLDHIGLAIRVIALFVIGAGLVVMAGALQTSRAQRLHESVLLRTLGASRGVVARVFAVEYACLGVAAGIGGSALAALLAWIVLVFLLDVPPTFEPAALAGGALGAVALAVAVGWLGTFRLLGQKPLPVLRGE
jgi:putative ABC transport system permease protein